MIEGVMFYLLLFTVFGGVFMAIVDTLKKHTFAEHLKGLKNEPEVAAGFFAALALGTLIFGFILVQTPDKNMVVNTIITVFFGLSVFCGGCSLLLLMYTFLSIAFSNFCLLLKKIKLLYSSDI